MSIYSQINLPKLLEQLRLHGIAVGAIELRHLQSVLQSSPSLSRGELSDLLCTVLANSAEQRNTVQRVFQQYVPYDHELPDTSKVSGNKTNKPEKTTKKTSTTSSTTKTSLLSQFKQWFNLWLIGAISLLSIVVALAFLAKTEESTSKQKPTPTLKQDKTKIPTQTAATSTNTIKKTTWTYTITHSETVSIQQRIFVPLSLLLSSGLALLWLAYQAWRRTRKPFTQGITISTKGTLHTPEINTTSDFYLLDARQRYKMICCA